MVAIVMVASLSANFFASLPHHLLAVEQGMSRHDARVEHGQDVELVMIACIRWMARAFHASVVRSRTSLSIAETYAMVAIVMAKAVARYG
ncbi:hypothetical protein ASE26_26765 [Duganella sp. Root198D2]|nr:hypothetical protein ASE26_26765 [Duganella sp. Root198D2]